MNRSNDPSCRDVRDELAALLYSELDGADRERVEQHLETCRACSGELAELALAKRALSAWSPASSAGEAQREAREAAAAVLRRASTLRRSRSIAFGLAAAVLAFLALSAFGAELDYGAGRVTLRFELPWVPRTNLASDVELEPDWSERMRHIAHTAADERLAAWSSSQTGPLADWSLREEQQRTRLVNAIDRARALDRESFTTVLAGMQRGAAQEIQLTREALTELAALVAREREH